MSMLNSGCSAARRPKLPSGCRKSFCMSTIMRAERLMSGPIGWWHRRHLRRAGVLNNVQWQRLDAPAHRERRDDADHDRTTSNAKNGGGRSDTLALPARWYARATGERPRPKSNPPPVLPPGPGGDRSSHVRVGALVGATSTSSNLCARVHAKDAAGDVRRLIRWAPLAEAWGTSGRSANFAAFSSDTLTDISHPSRQPAKR